MLKKILLLISSREQSKLTAALMWIPDQPGVQVMSAAGNNLCHLFLPCPVPFVQMKSLALPKEPVMLLLSLRHEELGPWVVHLLHSSSCCIFGSLVIDVLRVCSQNHGKEFASCVKLGLNVTFRIPTVHNSFRKLEQKCWGEGCSSPLC